ncbi:hypothetical protein MPTK1_8g11620 [Marchantia polymorpha subsp. ruderalis]|nr:hypothetical protein MARPO_0008s0054 [Marchantia polymorpha]BBN19550.1 hypothetical protein Mp_8g11620 [Marchantia polymorpha subsp. ruderalis]|eukprot:PTQ47274.1 hypothetical protein MARPO_0008s0054 [Marchantia polymorpha]
MWPVGSDDDEFQTSRRRALLADQSSPDVELHNFHGRSLLRDISPPGMWPVTSDDDEFADSSGHSRMLLSTDSSGSRSADPLQHEGALVHDISAPGKWPITSDAERRSTRHHHGRALLRDISPPGMWPSSDDDEFEFARRRALLAHAKTTADSPDPAGDGQTRKHRRALLRDISPPGMWLDSDDDDESEVSGGRMLLSSPEQSEGGSHKSRRALLRDISPPGMWPTSDDDEFEVSRRRALLSDNAQLSPVQSSKTNRERKHEQVLLRDSSPPQMWPISSAGDQSGVNRGRSLLSGRPHSSSAHAIKNEHPHQHRRALLRDISPPGMWPITSDDEAIEIARRRSLLSDGTFSSSVWASTDHQHGGRRALLRDISPPGMWPVGSDDDEFQVNRRRALLSDKSYSSSAKSSSIQHGRALLGDISPPGMWPITAADDRDILVRK